MQYEQVYDDRTKREIIMDLFKSHQEVEYWKGKFQDEQKARTKLAVEKTRLKTANDDFIKQRDEAFKAADAQQLKAFNLGTKADKFEKVIKALDKRNDELLISNSTLTHLLEASHKVLKAADLQLKEHNEFFKRKRAREAEEDAACKDLLSLFNSAK